MISYLSIHAAHVGSCGHRGILLRDVGNQALGGEDHGSDGSGVLQSTAADLGRVDNAEGDHVTVGVVGSVITEVDVLVAGNRVQNNGAFDTGVRGDLHDRGLQGLRNDSCAGLLIALEGGNQLLSGLGGDNVGGTAAGDDAFLNGSAGSVQGVLDAELLLLHLGLGGSTDFDNGDAAGQLGHTLLELLTVIVGSGGLDLTLDLSGTCTDLGGIAGTVDNNGVLLGDLDLVSLAEHGHVSFLQFHTELAGDNLTTGEDGDILQHFLAAIAEAGGLDADAGEGAAQLVQHDGGKGFALDVLGDDEELAAGLDNLLKQREDFLNVGDLLVGDEDECWRSSCR